MLEGFLETAEQPSKNREPRSSPPPVAESSLEAPAHPGPLLVFARNRRVLEISAATLERTNGVFLCVAGGSGDPRRPELVREAQAEGPSARIAARSCSR